ncbi:DUF423 domain-containing protein [Vibrio cholerae]
MNSKYLLALGGLLSGVAVGLGAFAAHGLKKMLSPYLLDVFETGVQYQFIHALALLVCGVLLLLPLHEAAHKGFRRAAQFFLVGIACFSGSLYALALTGVKWFGPITPFGGVMFILGWVWFSYAAWRSQ